MGSPARDSPLFEHARRGQRLIQAAATIESQEDFRVWRAERNDWIWTTAEALERWHGPEIAEAIRHAPGQPALTGDWRRLLPLELARVDQALETLSALGEQA